MEENKEEKEFTTATEFKKINTPAETILKHYENLYKRNQNKFIRRSKLEPEHLGSEFKYKKKNLKIVGSIDERQLIVVDTADETYYMIHIDIPTDKILKSK
jgi:biotin-(acetyl-CoA carboxylase) ligase